MVLLAGSFPMLHCLEDQKYHCGEWSPALAFHVENVPVWKICRCLGTNVRTAKAKVLLQASGTSRTQAVRLSLSFFLSSPTRQLTVLPQNNHLSLGVPLLYLSP